MTACATKGKLPETVIVGNLFLPLPGTDFRDYLDAIEDVAKSAPEIVAAIEKDWDDFKPLTIDSTAVKANSCWPTDARMLTGLLSRANRLGQKLRVFGLANWAGEGCKRFARNCWKKRWRITIKTYAGWTESDSGFCDNQETNPRQRKEPIRRPLRMGSIYPATIFWRWRAARAPRLPNHTRFG